VNQKRKEKKMQGHHLILGKITDFITGETLPETHDEQYRQKLARLLVEKKGYLKNNIKPRWELLIRAGDKKAIIKIDFAIQIENHIGMIIKYGPGSLVTRHRPVLAASRLLVPYQIPLSVATNGQDAEILNAKTGKLISSGLDAIPSKSELNQFLMDQNGFEAISPQRAEKESRILYAYEIDGSCPCDETVCRL
jgi:hypothetical protein